MVLSRSAIGQVSVTLAPPTRDVAATMPIGEVWFDVLVLNAADAPTTYTWPPTLPCRLTTPAGVIDAIATPDAAGLNPATLPANGFARTRYRAFQKTAGRVVIELTNTRAAVTVVNVEPPGAPVSARDDRASIEATHVPSTDALATQAPPRNVLEAVAQRDPNFRSEAGLVEYLAYRIKPHEPVYILAGNADPVAKFQLSFKYQIFDPNGPIAQRVPALAGLYFGYSQTSFWELDGDSNPFFDTSYRPEALVSYDNLDRFVLDRNGDRALPDWLRLGFQAGLRHESNGRDGGSSRSVNTIYARRIITFSGRDGWFLTLAPSIVGYVFDLGDNPDIQSYRGHADLKVVVGRGGGVQLAATGRLGDGTDRGSLELDFSVPIRQLTLGNLDVYFHTQYFTGYGESLLRYDQHDQTLRFGISLVR